MYTKKDKKPFVATWLKIVSYTVVALIVFGEYITGVEEKESSAGALGRAFAVFFIFGVLSIACAQKCVQWASKIKKSPNIGYAIGFFLFPVGILAYWIYYRKKSYLNLLRHNYNIQDR